MRAIHCLPSPPCLVPLRLAKSSTLHYGERKVLTGAQGNILSLIPSQTPTTILLCVAENYC